DHICYFTATATTEIYTLSLHDALPISEGLGEGLRQLPQPERDRLHHRRVDTDHRLHLLLHGSHLQPRGAGRQPQEVRGVHPGGEDRKSTRLNSSHSQISYAVFCLKKNR